MRVFLDDKRETPNNWVRTFTVEETIELLKTRQVLELSLDNDLGEGLQEGHVVLSWLEEQVFHDDTFPVPVMVAHSSNASRVEDMNRAITSIYRMEIKRALIMDIEQTIRQSIEKAKQNGFTLVNQDWGRLKHKCACPMACVILQDDPSCDLGDAPQASMEAAKLLRVSDIWVDSFIQGFDDEAMCGEDPQVQAAYDLGKKLRMEMKPVEYFEYLKAINERF